MSEPASPRPTDVAFDDLLQAYSHDVRLLALTARSLVRALVPDAVEEVDPTAKLLGITFIPGTYKGLILAIALQRSYVNLMFSRGVELLPRDPAGLLEGTGKLARHVKIKDEAGLGRPELRVLIRAAAERTRARTAHCGLEGSTPTGGSAVQHPCPHSR